METLNKLHKMETLATKIKGSQRRITTHSKNKVALRKQFSKLLKSIPAADKNLYREKIENLIKKIQ